jgi:putative endopeptidase
MNRWLWGSVCAALIAGCGQQAPPAPPPPPMAAAPPPLVSGIDTQYIDDSVRAQDDLYQHVNGKWLASTEIPADKGSYDQFNKVFDAVQDQLRSVVEALQKSVDAADPDQQKIADLYSSFMDEAALEPLGLKPLAEEFARIDALTDKSQIPSLIAHYNRIGVGARIRRRCIRTPRMRPSTCSISARTAWACRIAITTCRMTSD